MENQNLHTVGSDNLGEAPTEDSLTKPSDALSPSMIHAPEGLFSFNGKVAEIFEDMAVRSIPMYKEVHRLHASLLHASMVVRTQENPYTILDVGASRGGFIEEVCNQFHFPKTSKPLQIEAHAVDTSARMCELLKQDMPWVNVENRDVGSLTVKEGYDLITVFYTMQFVPPARRFDVLLRLYESLKPGGVLVIGAKCKSMLYTETLDREYHKWRMGNGYSVAEIHQKTQALEGSMWVETPEATTRRLITAGFCDIQETTRWCQFSTLIARKALGAENA